MVENGTGASRADALVRTMMAGGYRAHGGVGHGGAEEAAEARGRQTGRPGAQTPRGREDVRGDPQVSAARAQGRRGSGFPEMLDVTYPAAPDKLEPGSEVLCSIDPDGRLSMLKSVGAEWTWEVIPEDGSPEEAGAALPQTPKYQGKWPTMPKAHITRALVADLGALLAKAAHTERGICLW